MQTKILERIRQLKSYLKLSQQALADAGNISKGTVRNIFSGSSTPNTKALQGWAQNLDLNLNWLIAGEGEMFRQHPGKATRMPKTTEAKTVSTPIADQLAALEQSMGKATDLAKIRAMIDTLQGEHQELYAKKGGYGDSLTAREPSTIMAHESRGDYPDGQACGIDSRGMYEGLRLKD